MAISLNTQPAHEFGDDFFEITNIAPRQEQRDALELLTRIGLKTPILFGGSVRDVVYDLPFKDVDALGSYRDISNKTLPEIAQEIEARLNAQSDVSAIFTRIKFNYHTGGQQLIVQFLHKGVAVDVTLEDTQLSIRQAQARENVTLSGAYMNSDGRIIVHKSFLDAVNGATFKVVKYRSAKQFLIAIERYIRLRKRDAYRDYKFRVDIRACFRNRGTTFPEPWPSMAGIFKHAKRLVGRAKLHEPVYPINPRKSEPKPDEPTQN